MTTYDFVHLALHAVGDEIKGKTKLQKTVYFLGVLTGLIDELGYRAHYYGPYSGDVAAAVDGLKALGFIDQSVASGGAFDNFGFEVARYDFRLNDEGRKMAQAKAEANPELWKKLQTATAALQKAREEDYVKLSIAAKTFFMLSQKEGRTEKDARISSDEVATLAGKFGWSVTKQQVEEATRFLIDVGLSRG